MKPRLLIKRVFDLFFSATILLALSPFLLLIALLIKLDSHGPVLFIQDRLGYQGKPFRIYKFRSMIVNAENLGDGIDVFSENDQRITRMGRFLRKTSLDELPQLINILQGEMSLIGPRPPLTHFPYPSYYKYPPWAQQRFEMRPGITGLAQVTYRNSVPWDDRIILDNTYVTNFTLRQDLHIIWLTFKIIFQRSNIYEPPSQST